MSLHNAMFVRATLCLNRHHKLPAVAIQSDIDLIDLDLSDILHRCSQVILEGERGNPQKHIDQAVVTNLCQQRLFVAQCVGSDDFGSGIGNLDGDKFFARGDSIEANLLESVACAPCTFDDPLPILRCCLPDRVGKLIAVAERINYVADVFG